MAEIRHFSPVHVLSDRELGSGAWPRLSGRRDFSAFCNAHHCCADHVLHLDASSPEFLSDQYSGIWMSSRFGDALKWGGIGAHPAPPWAAGKLPKPFPASGASAFRLPAASNRRRSRCASRPLQGVAPRPVGSQTHIKDVLAPCKQPFLQPRRPLLFFPAQ